MPTILLMVFILAQPVRAAQEWPPESIDDVLAQLETPAELAEWMHGIRLDVERYEQALNNELPCRAQSPQETLERGVAICMDYAALIGEWCRLQDVDCYQVVYVYQWQDKARAHAYMMMPEYGFTMQNNGVLHVYTDIDFHEILLKELRGRPLLHYEVRVASNLDQCVVYER